MPVNAAVIEVPPTSLQISNHIHPRHSISAVRKADYTTSTAMLITNPAIVFSPLFISVSYICHYSINDHGDNTDIHDTFN